MSKLLIDIFNWKLLNSVKFKYSIIVIIAIVYPLFSFNNTLFTIIIMFAFVILAFTTGKILNVNFRNLFYVKITLAFIRIIFLTFSLIILLNIFKKDIENGNTFLIIFFCWLLIVIVLVWVLEILWRMFRQLQDLPKEGKYKKFTIIFCLSIILLCLVAPEYAFAYGYMIFFSVLSGIEIEMIEAYYLNFVITYTQPITNSNLSKYINIINGDRVLYTYQMIQVYSKKLIDLILLALAVGYLLEILKKK